MNTVAAAIAVTLEVGGSHPAPSAALPRTGADLDVLVLVGLTLLLAGAALLRLARTPSEATHA